jgi:4-hydroxy-4-methyl-2-oxoglutarate aldolase
VPREFARWTELGAATVSDALDRCGIAGQCFGIKPLQSAFKLAGRAFTVFYHPAGSSKGNVGDYIDDVPAGYVCVLDNGGRLDATVWGDLLTRVAHQRGLAGTVIHGVCRDVSRSLALDYPMFTRGAYMRTGKDRVQADAFNVPVSLGEVRVEAGDLVLGNADGVVVVPRAREAEVLELATTIEEAENRIRAATEDGMKLAEARKQFGYYTLQRKN